MTPERIAQQEPVGFIEAKADNECADAYADGWNDCVRAHKDTTPPQRPWVGLEAEDLAQIESDEFWQTGNHMAIAMAVEDKLKEKNT